MATFWDRATHSIKRMFSLYYDYFFLVISLFGVEGGTLVLSAPVPNYSLPLTFEIKI